ncbi:MAG: ead/Ea22-like family protein [Klebsiella michiganensis]|uniref:ead/Ea22-like family protein n=1 Tax=Klebsiella michiganensis TaxID=1134687 RepID=UPI00115E6557|nr:ead/Ea22-like family protein [Klebsiella michiganensis]MDU6583946.1 ead/Ea22-like family protein [Klebsiella michiganensis]
MTTDITELAQYMKAAAVLAKKYRSLTLTVSVDETLALVEALEYYKSREERVTSLVRDNSKSWDELYRQVEAKGKRNVELVEALESEKRICATWRKTAESTGEKLEKAQTINAAAEKLVRCKGRYHSEQNYRALAALFGVNTPDLPPLEHENVHYADAADMEIAALRQRIAELESRTVKLPDLRQIVSGDRYVWSDGVYNYSQDVKVALAAAGIKVEAE